MAILEKRIQGPQANHDHPRPAEVISYLSAASSRDVRYDLFSGLHGTSETLPVRRDDANNTTAAGKAVEWGTPLSTAQLDVIGAFNNLKHSALLQAHRRRRVPARLSAAYFRELRRPAHVLKMHYLWSTQEIHFTQAVRQGGGRQGPDDVLREGLSSDIYIDR